MPWTKKTYPDSMKNLPAAVRNKAIEIANALLKEKSMDEGIVIATAISRAKDWAANRGLKIKSKKSKSTDVKEHGKDRYVIPVDGEKWAVKEEGKKRVEKVFRSRTLAIKKAIAEAKKAGAGITVQKRDRKVQKKISYNPNRSQKKTSKRSSG